jgi:hypothetical protein
MRVLLAGLFCSCLFDTALADCTAEPKVAIEARLKALPVREVSLLDYGGESKSRVTLEIESLSRFHAIIEDNEGDGPTTIEWLILDGKGWSKGPDGWKLMANAVALEKTTADAERKLSDEVTENAHIECLGAVSTDGASYTAYKVTTDIDPERGSPGSKMTLYVDPARGLPRKIEIEQVPPEGAPVSTQTFDYDPSIKLGPPTAAPQ